jgi:hypothetical protein
MSVLDRPRTQYDSPAVLVERGPPVELPSEPPVASQWKPVDVRRWFFHLIVPFVLGAFFFSLALVLGETWPMTPAFLLGPLLMIAMYIHLCLTEEANSET